MKNPIHQTIICPIMVGRDQPIEALRHAFDQAQAGQGQIVLLNGEAGIGKSRLVRELKTQLQPSAPLIVQGTCFETDQTLPYAPITDLLRVFFASAAPERKQHALGGAVELIRLLPELAAEFPDGQPSAAEGDQEKRRLHEAMAQLFIRLAAAQPVVFIVEDIHWCDSASLEFLLFFARRLREQQLLLLLTYRDDELSPGIEQFLAQLNRTRLAVEFHLHRLPAEVIGAMIRAIFVEDFSAHRKFVDAIHSLSEGNPFFVEEMLKALVAAGDLYISDGQWKTKPLFELHVPRTIQVNLSQRVSQLTPAAREILSLAAVAGRRFDFSLLLYVSGLPESALLPILRELRDAQFVSEDSADRFTFRHALTQQAVYDDLLMRERRNLHRTMAEALEALYRDDPAHLGDMAHHYFQAEVWDKASSYAQSAAAWALKLYSPNAALEHYTRAIDAIERSGQIPPPELLRVRGQTYERTGNFESARDDYTRMVALAHEAGNHLAEWQGWSDLGWLWTERDFARAGEYFAHVLDLAQHVEAIPLLAQTLNRVGNWHLHADQLDQGLQYHQQALAISEQLSDVRGQAEALDLLGLTHYYIGEIAAGTDYYARCTALFRQLDDLPGLSASLSVMAMRGASYNLDTFYCPPVSLDTMTREGEEAVEAARKVGWRAGEASALLYCGFALGPRGALGQARRLTHQALDIATDIEHSQWQGASHMVLGTIYRDMLALKEARHHHEAVYKIVLDLHAPLLLRMVSGHLASTYAASGQIELAEKVLHPLLTPDLPALSVGQRLVWCAKAELALAQGEPETALDILERLRQPNPIPRLDYLRGEALRRLGRRSAAENVLRAADAAAAQQGALPLRWHILVSLGRCFQEQNRHEQADDAFAEAEEIIRHIADTIDDAHLRENFLTESTRQLYDVYHPSPRRAAKKAYDGLTTRERQIAALIAEGRSNRAIAETLILSERTVAKHVENILSKLSFTSRAQIAAWAVERGLRAGDT